jgi:NAD+ synthase
MSTTLTLNTSDCLRIDPARETERIVAAVRDQVTKTLRRKGVVLGLSGGIDSSVCAALCVRAGVGAEARVGATHAGTRLVVR